MSNEDYTPDNMKQFREMLDNIVLNIYNLPYEQQMRACDSLKSFSGKFARVTAGATPFDEDFQIVITPNKDNLDNFKYLTKQKEHIESQLLKIENPHQYNLNQESKHNEEYPWKAGYVCNMKEGTENPIISSYTAHRAAFNAWYQQTLSVGHDTNMGFIGEHTDEKEFRTHEAADEWLKGELTQYEI